MGGIASTRMQKRLAAAMAVPTPMAARAPRAARPLPPLITLMPTKPANGIVYWTERSILPLPLVITNIWPIPTITRKGASAMAAVIVPRSPRPETATIPAHMATTARNTHIQGNSTASDLAVAQALRLCGAGTPSSAAVIAPRSATALARPGRRRGSFLGHRPGRRTRR